MRTYTRRGEAHEIQIQDIEEKAHDDGTKRVIFRTSHGRLDGIYHPVEDAKAAVVMVSGAGGGFNGPANVYHDLAAELSKQGIASFRLDYRFPNRLDECIVDSIIGIQYLLEEGIEDFAIIGWSFGGAVAITTAALHEDVKAVATVATQSYGTEGARHLEGKPILLMHGTEDKTLPVHGSEHVYSMAGDPKELVVYEGANHGLDQVRDKMLEKLRDFMVGNLG
jgi:dipeptidyl aminopeptidase/acylaminoacyl peptidase